MSGLSLVALALVAASRPAAETLTLYFVDVEGGQATLVVTPAGESLLVDTGFYATSFSDFSNRGRDPKRILAAARDAGLKRIDVLVLTHFHADHDGGAPDLARQIPILTFVDHGDVPKEAEQNVPGTLAAFDAYAKVRASGKHMVAKPGDRLPLKGVEATVLSSAGATISQPLLGAGAANPSCGPSELPPQDSFENPRSTGLLLQFGKFRFLDVGDLTGKPLFALACPRNLLGPVDVYLVAHHGGPDAADPATLAAFRPRVAVIDNGPTKGGARETFEALRALRGLDDVWQLHQSLNPGVGNVADDRIANLDEDLGAWIKLVASDDGSFVVTNGRTGASKTYAARAKADPPKAGPAR